MRWLLPLALLAAGAARAQDPGERDFQRCISCHSVADPLEEGLPGPGLRGVFGRRAASQQGFAYSEPLRRSGLVWDRTTLDRFLADPEALVPGTLMGLPPLRDAALRQRIIDYLARQG
ncbi:c-type cytochrome [Siccirubricoccus sp. G192]|uniref:c-type cytochrome n=1 Tax=Siccirubricoccus sp. G192 TaxID=2849651 RepID=UPI001C2CB886|nr:c-type cytochrome [Siccirubricoccus sp. G192]MBV1799563.1 c-type cytochrome [Siccirubricoccus sp. G192]